MGMMTRVTTLVMMASSSANALLMISALVQLTASPSSSAVTSALMTDMSGGMSSTKDGFGRSTSPLTSVGTDRCGMMA